MKRTTIIAAGLLVAVIARADDGFVRSLTPEDYAAAGLQKLTPEELARLEAAVQRYKSGEVAVVRQQAEAKAVATQQEVEKRIAAAETKAREAEAKADETAVKSRQAGPKATAPAGRKQPGWFMALLTLRRAGEQPGREEPLESRLAGDFDGWHGHTVFTLEDGTRWQQQNRTESYEYSPVLHSPKVKIRPASISGFWMEIEGVNLNVRVVPVELKEEK